MSFATPEARIRADAIRMRWITWWAPRVRGVGVCAIVPLSVLVLWQVATARGWISPQILPSPLMVLTTFFDLVRTGAIADNLAISLRRIALGFSLGATLGLLFGSLIGLSRTAEQFIGPIFRALAAVPSLGWLPILILIFGIDETLKVLIITKATLVPIVLNTSQAIRNVPRHLIEVASVLRLRRSTTVGKLFVPATLPTVFTGIRLASSHAFIALIVAEMLAGTEGVGYMMTWGRTLFQTDIVIVGMMVVGILGFTIDCLLRKLEARMRRWSPVNP
jgi:sulfonate transport system permease protein